MNGAQALIRTLARSGVEVCFTNPGTSEMHFVAALDAVPAMRGVLGLFEGAVTGAADGYARIAGKPAATLLHVGPGLANGAANLHNARRANSPIVNVVGDHATYHKKYDTPLESDIPALAGTFSGWVRCPTSAAEVAAEAANAVAASRRGAPGQVATLILPADVSWNEGAQPAEPVPLAAPAPVDEAAIVSAARLLRGDGPVVLLLGGDACRAAGLRAAGRISAATGAEVLVETFPARLESGAGLPGFDRLQYLTELALGQLADFRHVLLAGVRPPVSFFAYPGLPSELTPEAAEIRVLVDGTQDVIGALESLADLVAPHHAPVVRTAVRRELPTGPLTPHTWADVIAALLPEGAIISDESVTSGFRLPQALAGAARHDLLTLTGGAIGQGLPVATGAAVAAPDRPVISLQADGSAMYTLQALWTQARENLDVTTVILSNSAYAILRLELQRVNAGAPGPRADRLLDLAGPGLDFVRLSEGLGVPAVRATTAEELARQFARALAEPGPHLIEAVLG
jgi:acetolactate synthase I/II/III large subunit